VLDQPRLTLRRVTLVEAAELGRFRVGTSIVVAAQDTDERDASGFRDTWEVLVHVLVQQAVGDRGNDGRAAGCADVSRAGAQRERLADAGPGLDEDGIVTVGAQGGDQGVLLGSPAETGVGQQLLERR